MVVEWFAELAPDREVLGLIPAPLKLFWREPAALKFVWCQDVQTKDCSSKNNLSYVALTNLIRIAFGAKKIYKDWNL